MSSVIKVEGLSKKYFIGHQTEDSTLRDALTNGARRFRDKLFHPMSKQVSRANEEEFWALKDISFDIKQGDRMGIIGQNGAGKSTLLKILSRITEPTSGKITINGRVSSLLEVGTGFHPELTGRENIFLNGAILGMGKNEIRKKFDEIVAFSEVEKFLDTPVKRYSSGMYVRLAFSVAAHLEPEILIVDEVLAVGDAQFQKKCMGKIEDVGKEGRTVLFVSHNMNVINRLCFSGILLSAGQIVVEGSADEVVHHYLNTTNEECISKVQFADDPEKPYQVVGASLHDASGGLVETQLEVDAPVTLKIFFKLSRELPGAYAGFSIRNSIGEIILISDNRDIDDSNGELERPGIKSASIVIPTPLLVPGKYFFTVAISQQGRGAIDRCMDALTLEIVNIKSVRTNWAGYVHIPMRWDISSQ